MSNIHHPKHIPKMVYEYDAKIEKIFYTRILELYQSLNILKSNLNNIKLGNNYLINSIYGQLRAIMTDKTQRDPPPLLFAISNHFKIETEIFYKNSNFDFSNGPLAAGLLYHLANQSITFNRTSDDQVCCDLNKFLDKEILFFKGHKFSTRTLINDLANKQGGSHYDNSTLLYLIELQNFRLNGISVLEDYIVQFTDIVIGNIIKILSNFFDFDMNFRLYLTTRTTKNLAYIIDFQYSLSPINISIIHLKNKLLFKIRDESYNTIQCKINTLFFTIFTSQLVTINYSIDSNLKPILSIYIGLFRIKRIKFDFPFLLTNDIQGFIMKFNRSQDIINTNYSFGISDFRVYNRILTKYERAQLIIDSHSIVKKKNKVKHLLFKPDSYGIMDSISQKMYVEGNAESVY